MSCAETPGGIPCSEVLDNICHYLHGELDQQRSESMREHLEDCSGCLREYGLERLVRELLHRSCHCSAPQSLRQAVISRIAAVSPRDL